MGEWLIYGSNGVAKATVKKLEYNGEFMGETIVTCDVYSPSPISFSVGDYLSYRGENFVIDYDATRKKQSRVNTYGNGFVYEGMKFTSYVGELKKCDFLDFVLNDNLQHYSQLPTFDFYAETVEALADRLQANLNRMYTGSNAWTVSVVSGFEGKENVNVQISNIKCFDALKMAYEQFNAQYVIRGRNIYIGTAGSSLETTFRYGIGNGLKTIERSVDENDSLVTRLRAYGNTTNLPSNYYANKGRGCYAPIFEVYALYDSGADIHFKPKFANNWFTEKSGASGINYWVSVSLDKKLWVEGVASPNVTVASVDFSVVSVMAGGNNTTDMYNAFKAQLQNATQNTKLYFSKGVNYTNWKSDWKETDEYMPNMMSIDRLMIPSFPEESTDPYIDSANISSLGIREKSVYFDGSEDELPDIHPSMEGMTAAELRAAGYTIDLDQGDNGNLDEIAADATELDGSAITTNGAFVEVNEVPGFKVTLKDIGFDINSYLSGDTATLSMKSGMCGGRDFTIVKVTKLGNKYVLECQRIEDANYYFPYNPYNIKAGDKFVLTNIEMPQAYIDAASQRLLVAAQEYLAKHSVPQWVYSIKMDDVWMQRQRDNSESESESYYWNIKEGDIMSVQDSDLDINVSEVIDRLTIREGYSPIPEFEVVLRKEKPQGTIGVLQNRIKNLERQNQQQTNTIVRQQDYISLIIGDKLNTIQEQLDHVQVTYFGDYVPTLSNEPASTWQSSEYSEHDGDMFYNRTSGKGYEFTYQNGTWGWIEIQDEDIRQALEEAAAAQDTADGKRRVFVTPAGTLPTPPYDENDLWVNATYPSDSTSTDESQHKYYNDILKCVTPKAEGGTANINDWTLASKYTDDSSLNAFINGSYADDLEDIQNQIDGKAETWYQNTDPSTAWTTTALKNQHKGDIWHNSSNTTINGVKAGQDAIWNGTAWVVDETVPQAVYDTIDGKAAIYVTWGAWGNELQVKDLFIPSANTTQGGVTYKANKVYRCTNKTTPTFQEIAYTDDAALNAFLNGYTGTLTGIRNDITNAATAASNAQTSADNANTAAAAAQATADALDYLKQAYSADNTLIDHGLILSTIVALRDSSNNVWSGISGAYDSTKLGNGIAAWYGGGMIDGEVSQVANAAKSLFRFDGSGYVASGNLKWDANGNVTIQGYSINASTLQVGGANVATQAMLNNFVSKAFFNRLFTAYDANGNAIVPNDTTTAINNLKLMVGTWTEQYLSALGLNSEGGGGGGAGLEDVWDSLTNQQGTVITDNTKIAIAHIPDTSSTYGYLKASALSGYATQTWVNQQGFLTTHQTLYTLSIYGGTTKVLDFKPNANASIYIKAEGDISLTNDTTNKYITLSYTHPTNGANTTISAASGKVLSAITVNNLGHVTSVSSKTLASADIPDISATYATASRATTLEGYFTNGVANTAAKLNTGTTTYTAWGQTYWSSGVPQSISGNMTSVGSITPSANGNALGTTSARFNIYGTAGNFSGNVSVGGTLGVTGATTLSSTLSVASGITLTTTKKIYFGDTSHYLELNSTGFHFSHGVYSDSFVSALGANSSGGGGGIDLDAMWAELQGNTGTYANAKINVNHIPDISSTYGYAKTSQLGSYLPLSGGTMTGDITFVSNKGFYAKDTGGTSRLAMKLDGTDNLLIGYGTSIGGSNTYIDGNTVYIRYGTSHTTGITLASGGNVTIANRLLVNEITATNSEGLLVYKPSSGWSGISNTQWGTGSSDSQGVIRSSNADLIHYKGGVNYTILDSSNYSSYALPISGGTLYKNTTDAPLFIKTHNTSGAYIGFQKNDGTTMGFIGVHPTYGAVYVKSGTTYPILRSDNFGEYAYALYGGTDLAPTSTNTINLNELRSTGSYYVSTNAPSQYVTNKPDDTQDYAFRVWVSAPGGTSGYRRQRFQYLTQMTIYERFYSTDTSTWTNWYKVQGDLDGEYLKLTGGTITGNLTVKNTLYTDAICEPIAYNGLLVYHPASGWGGISSTQWGVGSADSQGVIRSSDANLIHYKGTTNYTICDGSNTYVGSGGIGYINGSAISKISGNAGTATTLATPRTLWGQSFNGSANVSGDMSSVGDITATYYTLSDTAANPYLKFVNTYNSTNYTFYVQAYQGLLYLGAGSTQSIVVNSAGSVGVGTSSPAYKLHVYGQLGVTTASQGTMRFVSAGSKNYIQSGNAAFDDNADMIIGGYNATTGTNLDLAFSTVKATSVFKVKEYLTLGYGGVGIYLTSSGINWHNSADTYTKSIMSFNSLGVVTQLGGHFVLAGAQAASSTGNTTQIIFTASGAQQVAISSNSSALIINPTSSTTTKQIILGVGSVASTFGNSITCSGEVTASSDGRKKNIISNTKFNVKDIASARSVLFEWNDGRDDDMEKKIHGGSIAQDWLGKADSFLLQDNDGFYSINYGALALCSAITIAKEVVKHEDRITLLEKENAKLKARVAELEERRIA